MEALLTKAVLRITRTLPNRPISTFWAMRKEIVLITNILEEVDLVPTLEESSRDAVYYRISPALEGLISATSGSKKERVKALTS